MEMLAQYWRWPRLISRTNRSSVFAVGGGLCGSLLANALGRQFQSRGRNTRSLRMEGPLRITLPSRKIGGCWNWWPSEVESSFRTKTAR